MNNQNMGEGGFNQQVNGPQAPFSRVGKKTVKKSLVIALIVAAVLIAGGVFAYTEFFPSSSAIFSRMIKNSAEVKSVEYRGEIKLGGPAIASLGFEGAVDVSDEKNLKSSSIIRTDLLNALAPLLTGLSREKTVSSLTDSSKLEIEQRTIGEVSYFNLKSFPALGALLGSKDLDGVLNSLKDRWIKIDLDSIARFSGIPAEELRNRWLIHRQ